MSERAYTLERFFLPGGGEALSPSRYMTELERSDALTRLRRLLARKAKSLSWALAASEISHNIPKMLDVDVEEILAVAWETSAKIDAYLKRSERDPQEVFLVHLAEHKLHSSHKPYLEIRVNGEKVGQVRAEVQLELLIQAAVLKIEGGRIQEIRTGSLRGEGSFSVEGIRLLEAKSKEIALPGTLRLDAPCQPGSR